jgi:hypothetical protein
MCSKEYVRLKGGACSSMSIMLGETLLAKTREGTLRDMSESDSLDLEWPKQKIFLRHSHILWRLSIPCFRRVCHIIVG